MSHQTGISASEELLNVFADARKKNYRVIKVGIDLETEKLVPLTFLEECDTWEKDYDTMVPGLLEETVPCYIFHRLDELDNSDQYRWMFIAYSPECAEVKFKMLYAATKSKLRLEFGSGQIKHDLHETDRADVTYAGFLSHLALENAPAPLTAGEEELKLMKEEENVVNVGSSTKQSHLQGIMFPLEDAANDKLNALKNGDYNYVRLAIDIKSEVIMLDDADTIVVDKLPSKVSTERPGYHVFNFLHTHEGDYQGSIMLIYSVPESNCPVKERMIYTSLLGPFCSYLEIIFKFTIAKRVEIGKGEELTEEFLISEIHPVRNLVRPAFAKPKGPAGKRGQRRIVKDDQK